MHALRIVALATVALSCLLCRPAAADTVVDLTTLDWTVKPGFAPRDADGFPPGQGRRAEMFPIVPNELFAVEPGAPLQHFTLQTTFALADVRDPQGELLGLHLANIGENWEIFVNGERLAAAIDVRDGRLAFRRSVRDLMVALPPDMLRKGENRLVVHLAGDAPATRLTSNTALGFFQRAGYHIESLGELHRKRHDYDTSLLLAMFGVFTAYAGVLAWFRRKERHHAILTGLSGSLVIYFFTRTRYVFDLVHDTEPITRVEYASLFAAGGLMFAFLHAFLGPHRPWPAFLRVFVPLTLLAALAVLLAPFGYADPILLAWQAVAVVAAVYMVWYVGRAAAARMPDAASLVPSLFLFSMTVLWDITDSIYLHSGHRLSHYAFAFYIATLAYVAAMRTVRMRRATLRHLAELQEREARLNALFEASFEALVLHVNGKIVDVNPSFTRMFGYSLDEVGGRRVDDLFAKAVSLDKPESDGRPGEAPARRRDGSTFTVEYKNRPWAWDGVTGEVLTLRDVDEPKRAEGELRERNAELEILARSMHDRESRLHELEAELERLRKQRG